MRVSLLHEMLAHKGATCENRYGVEIVSKFTELSTEYHFVRDTIGLTDFSHMQRYSIPEATAVDFFDTLVAGAVIRTRFGRMLHTFIADESGTILADCFVANNDDEYILLCESIVDDVAMAEIMHKHGGAQEGLVDLSADTVLLSLDGFSAWKVVKELFGTDVLGLPYLSVENYTYENEKIRLFRTGKTSEFGYLLMAPKAIAIKLTEHILAEVEKHKGGLCGLTVHDTLRLEGRFFNIFAEGVRVGDPLVLGLQWMIDFDKSAFIGRQAIIDRREKGLTKKIIGIKSAAASDRCAVSDSVWDNEKEVASVVATCFSEVLDRCVGLAVFPADIAYSGLSFHLKSVSGPTLHTISMPPIMPKSLSLKLDEM